MHSFRGEIFKEIKGVGTVMKAVRVILSIANKHIYNLRNMLRFHDFFPPHSNICYHHFSDPRRHSHPVVKHLQISVQLLSTHALMDVKRMQPPKAHLIKEASISGEWMGLGNTNHLDGNKDVYQFSFFFSFLAFFIKMLTLMFQIYFWDWCANSGMGVNKNNCS